MLSQLSSAAQQHILDLGSSGHPMTREDRPGFSFFDSVAMGGNSVLSFRELVLSDACKFLMKLNGPHNAGAAYPDYGSFRADCHLTT